MMDVIFCTRRYYINYFKRYPFCQTCCSTKYSSMSSGHSIVPKKFAAVQTKVYDFLKWYEHMTGIDEIRYAQNKVIEAQERFAAAQDKRREVTLELNEVKNKIKDLQEELSTIPRGDERYITLITKEHKLLKEEIRLTDKFNIYEREERELFTTLTSSVKESHEKERIQANKTKYISIIGSVMGAMIGIIGSTINNRSKLAELRKMVVQSTEDSKKELETICAQLEKASKSISSVSNDEVARRLQDVSEKLVSLTSDVSSAKNLELSASRIEEKIATLIKKVEHISNGNESDTDESKTSDFEQKFPYLASIKDEISYSLISLFTVYFVYKLFFPY